MGDVALTRLNSSFSTVRGTAGGSVDGKPVKAKSLITSARAVELDRRASYYDCTQNDWKSFDFDGRVIKAGPPLTQPFLSSEQASWYVPLKLRRPSSPYRLPRIIVDAFTNLLFGEERFPKVLVQGDPETQDFDEALVRAAKLKSKLILARTVGGSTGTVGISWLYKNGKPRVDIHNPKSLWVHEWEDREMLVPAWVSEIYVYPEDQIEGNEYVRRLYWYRRDWTMDEELLFERVEYKRDREPAWTVDQRRSISHGDGDTHFVWIQNLPSQEADGLPDYHGLYESFDSLDVLFSVLTRGTTLNLDPTLLLKVDPDLVARSGVKKGSDNALILGEEGDANYLELEGTAVEAGVKLFEVKRRSALEAAQCVLPDPHEIAASGTSSVAMKVIYQPMLAKTAVLREQYGEGLMRLLDGMNRVARERIGQTVQVVNDQGEQEDAVQFIDLPAKVESEDVLDANGIATGEKTTTEVEREPGDGGEMTLQWGEWFPPTQTDKQAAITTLQTACGKPVLSQQSAVEEAAAVFGRDPAEELKRVTASAKVEQDREDELNQQFADQADAGGAVKPPPGGAPKPNKAGGAPEDPDDKALNDEESDPYGSSK